MSTIAIGKAEAYVEEDLLAHGAWKERLQEYRTALITAAVTGKIDVRKER